MEKKRILIVFLFILVFIIAIILSIISYTDKYYVKFETGTNDIFLTKYVNKNSKINEPSNPTKDGYIFKEWQLNGEKYDFNTNIKSDIVLTAKWIKEEYVVVNFDTGTDEKIDSVKILKGDILKELPMVDKENYNFLGWFMGDKKYDNEEIYSDVTFIAKFEPNKLNSTYKIGDSVRIVGSYSNAAYFVSYISTKAIGWERKIIGIYEDGEYPYRVGNENGTIGYFKAESLQLIVH